jgi:methionyl-tRNA synthetase
MRDRLRDWINSKTDWPVLTTSIAKKWLDDGDGLQDRGITRDLDWGVPVKKGDADWPGMEGKVFYVWFDAPIEYIACAAEWVDAGKGDDWERWWRTDKGADDVRYVQFMGKDNVPFHTLSFPPRSSGQRRAVEARRLHQIVQLPELRWRPVLDLPGARRVHGPGAGNPALRLLALVASQPRAGDLRQRIHVGGVPAGREQGPRRRPGQFRQPDHQVLPLEIRGGRAGGRRLRRTGNRADRRSEARLARYQAHMDAIEVRKAAAELRAIWVAGNEYLQSAAPWTAFKEDPDRAAAITRFALNLIPFYAGSPRPSSPMPPPPWPTR